MKYYFPTTTLNFDSILSSQMISPSGKYKPDTLWWNRNESVLGEREDALAFYSKCPIWEIDDPSRDNYPMVVEIDKVFAKQEKYECALGKSLKVTFLLNSLTFSLAELMQGKIRFLFRTKEEMDRMLTRAIAGVAECKIGNVLRMECPTAFSLIPSAKSKIFKLDSVVEDVLKARLDEITGVEYTSAEIAAERIRGAELGYQVGRYVKSLRTGFYMDAFRDPLVFGEWKQKILPAPYAALLDKMCSRPLLLWDPNRAAIVQFCKECWFDCFKGKQVDGKEVLEDSDIHASLQALARHWASPEESYRISSEKDPFMQSFAAFLECGTQASKYPRFMKEPLLRLPEYLLSLYGALVGYTSFSRILLDNKVYLPSPEKRQETVGNQKVVRRDVPVSLVSRESSRTPKMEDAIKEPQSIVDVVKERVVGAQTSKRKGKKKKKGAESAGQMGLFDEMAIPSNVADEKLLVYDAGLSGAIMKEFAYLGADDVRQLCLIVQKFAKGYGDDGFYGSHPDRYKKENPDLIDHLVKCFSAPRTPELNFIWPNGGGDEERFVTFLEQRYGCRRKQHLG